MVLWTVVCMAKLYCSLLVHSSGMGLHCVCVCGGGGGGGGKHCLSVCAAVCNNRWHLINTAPAQANR